MSNRYFYTVEYRRPADGAILGYSYSRSYPLAVQDSALPPAQQGGTDTWTSNAVDSAVSRAKKTVRLLAFANPNLNGFLTLTFRGTPDENRVQTEFDRWRRAVARKYGQKRFKFLGVKELQKRGIIHYHLLVNFCPDMVSLRPGKFSSGSWTAGYSDFSLINGDENFDVSLYLLKYLAKNMHAHIFSQAYVRSRGLTNPIPRYYDFRRPIPHYARLFHRSVGNGVVGMEIMEYSYVVSMTQKGDFHELQATYRTQ